MVSVFLRVIKPGAHAGKHKVIEETLICRDDYQSLSSDNNLNYLLVPLDLADCNSPVPYCLSNYCIVSIWVPEEAPGTGIGFLHISSVIDCKPISIVVWSGTRVIERSRWLVIIYLFIYLYFTHICSGRNWIQNVSTTGQVLDNRKLVICGPQRRTGSLQLNCFAEKGCIIAPRNVMTALWCRSAFPDSDFNQ